MTYIVKAYKYKDAKRILKGWDGKIPVWITQGQYNKGNNSVQEYASTSAAMRAVEKIKTVEDWRHYEIVGLV